MRVTPALILALPIIAACADAAGEWRGTVRDSASVSIVENPALPVATDAWTAREVLRIGSADGALETQFGLIAAIAVDDDGRYFVLDQQNRRVRIFDAEGGFVRELGGSGAGPGELSGFTIAVMVDPGDTVWVADVGNARFERYTMDGTAVGSVPMPVPGGALPVRFAMLEDGSVVELVRSTPTARRPEMRDDLLLRIARDGTVSDTVHRMPGGSSVEFRDGVAIISVYAPDPVWAISGDGRVYTGMSDEYRIEVRNSGSLERIIVRDTENRPVTEADQRAFFQLLRRSLREQGVDPAAIEQTVQSMTFAATYPAFAHFLPGPQGTLWVQQIRTAEDVAEGETFDAATIGSDRWDVFDESGRYVATARLPDRFTPLMHRGETFIGLWRDPLDVQYVLVVEVGPATES